MTKLCSICVHDKSQDIELLLVRGDISNQHAAQQFGVPELDIRLHRRKCLPRLLEKARVLQSFITLFFENKVSQVDFDAKALQQVSAECPIRNEQETGKLARIIRADEVADLLGVTQQQVYGMVRKKLIPHFRVGIRQIRFQFGAVVEWRDNGGSKEQAK